MTKKFRGALVARLLTTIVTAVFLAIAGIGTGISFGCSGSPAATPPTADGEEGGVADDDGDVGDVADDEVDGGDGGAGGGGGEAPACGNGICEGGETVRTCHIDCPAPALPENVIAVDQAAMGANTGTSWSDAFTDLETALSAAVAGQQIWVAEGTYIPTRESVPGNPASATFTLNTNVAIYGGFPTHGGLMADRNFRTYLTVLSGDLDRDDPETRDLTESGITQDDDGDISNGIGGIRGHNARNIVYISDVDDSAILDGFIITGAGRDYVGGGIRMFSGSPILRNLTIAGNMANSGGGMFCSRREATPTLSHVEFIGNYADSRGGAIRVSTDSTLQVSDTRFAGNHSGLSGGGAISSEAATLVMRNVLFDGNQSSSSGGGLHTRRTSIDMTNVAFLENQATSGGAILVSRDTELFVTNGTFSGNLASAGGGAMFIHAAAGVENRVTIANSLFYDNDETSFDSRDDGINTVSVSFSLLQLPGAVCPPILSCAGHVGFLGELSPFAEDGLHLRAGSPAIDAGSNLFLLPEITTDLDGNPRRIDDPATVDTGTGDAPLVDLGAYEFQP